MAFTMFAVFNEQSPATSIEALHTSLSSHFSGADSAPEVSLGTDDFGSDEKSVLLGWSSEWWVRIYYEAGTEVREEMGAITAIATDPGANGILNAARRVRAVFADDARRVFTNEATFVLDFLGDIPGVRIFDPRTQSFVSS